MSLLGIVTKPEKGGTAALNVHNVIEKFRHIQALHLYFEVSGAATLHSKNKL